MKLIIILFFSIIISYFATNTIANSKEAIDLLVNAYSILAAILITVITIIADPSDVIDSSNWREAFYKERQFSAQLKQISTLFYVYLITLMLIFISYLFGKDNYPSVKYYIEHCYVFFASVAILWSFSLPWLLADYKISKLKNIVENKRK